VGLLGLGSAVPELGEPELGEAVVGEPVLGECGAALGVSGPQPVSTMMVADTATAGQNRFVRTSKLLYLSIINIEH